MKIEDLNNIGTITNTYGVYVGNLTSGTQTNKPFSFYASDGNALNYFAGPIRVGGGSIYSGNDATALTVSPFGWAYDYDPLKDTEDGRLINASVYSLTDTGPSGGRPVLALASFNYAGGGVNATNPVTYVDAALVSIGRDGHGQPFPTGTNGNVTIYNSWGLLNRYGLRSDGTTWLGSSGASKPAWGTEGIQLQVRRATFTDSSSAASATVPTAAFSSFATPILAATNSSVTTTDAATVYIAGGPEAGTNQTITHPWGLWNVGATRLDGNVSIANTTPSTSATTGALTVAGGAGIAGNLTVGGTFTAATFASSGLTGGNTGLALSAGGTNQNVTITPSGTGSTIVNGNATIQNSLTVAGNITGVSTGLALAAGGTNQNVTLTPSGTGSTFITGNLGLGAAIATVAPLTAVSTNSSAPQVANLAHYSNSRQGPGLTFSKYRGTPAAPASGGANDVLFDIQANDFDGTNSLTAAEFMARVDTFAPGDIRGTFYWLTGQSGSMAERMRLTSAGYLGIGTVAPQATLDVAGNAAISGNLSVGGTFTAANYGGGSLTGGTTGLALNAGGIDQNVTITPSGTGSTIVNGNATVQNNLTVSGAVNGGTSGLALTAGGTDQNVTITPSGTGNTILNGKVGIGVAAPQAKLHVADSGGGSPLLLDAYSDTIQGATFRGRKARGSATAPRRVQSGDTLSGVNAFGAYAADDASSALFSPLANGGVRFHAAENFTETARGTYLTVSTTPIGSPDWTEQMRVTDSGNVGIGTATPSAKLDVAGVVRNQGVQISNLASATILGTDSSGNVTSVPTSALTLSSSQVTTALGFTPYNSTNPSGYITAGGAPVQSVFGRTGAVTMASADVTGALGFTPYNASNPAGYITSAGAPVQSIFGRTGTVTMASSDVTTALGYTPYNSTNPSSYITAAGAPVQSVFGRTGAVTLTAADLTSALTFTPVNKAGDTLTGTLTLAAGTAAVAPLTLQSGTSLTTPVFGAVEFDGTNLYLTNNASSPTRKTLAYSATTLAGYGITDPVVLTSGSYTDPAWITSLAAAKLTGTLTAALMPAFSGDVTSSAGSTTLTLANSGVIAGTYAKVTVDAKGRVTSGASLAPGDITGALGYTPYNSTNPSGFITAGGAPVQSVFGRTGSVTMASADVTSALGFTPYNATNPSGYITASGAPVQSVFGRTGAVTLTAADLTSALTFTPANKAGDTFTGSMTFAAGTTSTAPLALQNGSLLNTPAFGAVEFDGTNVYVTNNASSPTRKTLAYSATTLAGYGITDPVVLTSGSYSDPAWIASLAAAKLTGTLTAALMPAFTGDVTSSAGSTALTLANSGVTAGTYAKVTVDAKGRVTSGASLASGDVTGALGFTPYNSTNPSGFITAAGAPVQSVFGRTGNVTLASSDVTTALGFTPLSSSSGTFSGAVSATGLTATAGTVSGGSTGLTLSAGGTNQNVIVSPSGTGSTIINGNLGIGTTNPTALLQITAPTGIGSSNALLITRAGGYGETSFAQYYNSILDYGLNVNSGQFALNAANGNVGIGSANPTAKLDVAGDVKVSGNVTVSTASSLSAGSITGTTMNVVTSGNAVYENTPGAGNAVFFDNALIGSTIRFRTSNAAADDTTALLLSPAGNGTLAGTLAVNGTGTSTFAGSITATGLLTTAGTVRATSNTNSTSGTGAEMAWDGTNGYFLTYDRTNGQYKPTQVLGSSITLGASGQNTVVTGNLTVSGAGTSSFAGNVTVQGGLSVSGTFSAPGYTASSGTVTGGSTGLVLNAGGTNQNVTITPSGTGATVLNGNVGIGTSAPSGKLTVTRNDSALGTTGAPGLWLENAGTGDSGITFKRASQLTGGEWQVFQSSDANKFKIGRAAVGDYLTIDTGGNVGIGTTNPGTYKLAVNGSVHAKEVVVDQLGWSDYVFDDNYRNAPLSEVEAHIKAHKHLPGVPSASEVAEKGVNVGQMESILLKKIEELTLHQIEQEKRMQAQDARIQKLEAENTALRSVTTR